MSGATDTPSIRARRQRRIAATILATFAAWAVVQFAGARLGLPIRWMGLIDLVVLAVLGSALWMLVGLWRTRKE